MPPHATISGIPPQRFQILGAVPFLRPLVLIPCLQLVSKFPIFSTFVDPMPGTKVVLTHQRVRGQRRKKGDQWPLTEVLMDQSPDCLHLEEGVVGHTPSVLLTRLMLKKPIDMSWEHTSTRLFSSLIDHQRNTSVFGSSLPGVQPHLASSDGAHATTTPMGK